jgi:cytochrome oxidase Cu insertion factor (SCO1/SenC/PrrC family)
MNPAKNNFLLLALSVIGLGIVLGTFLWIKLQSRDRYRLSEAQSLEGLNEYGPVPEFSLTERNGKTANLAGLRGKVWIADFIYTTCTDTCPMQSAEMARLQEHWNNRRDIRLVSFSVDPEQDTPQVLTRYAEHFKADADRWLFLTGNKEQILRLVQEGFRLSATPARTGGADEDVILHSPWFVLIDRAAQIRGYYDSRDTEALQRLNKDVVTLLSNRKE